MLQWASTAFLWSQWLIQDLANIYVFVPRVIGIWPLIATIALLLVMQGIIFYQQGGRIQQIVTTKTMTSDIRSATIIDFVYGMILLIFKEWSNMPMSTTWVFLGLLAGREIAMNIAGAGAQPEGGGEIGRPRCVQGVHGADCERSFWPWPVSISQPDQRANHCADPTAQKISACCRIGYPTSVKTMKKYPPTPEELRDWMDCKGLSNKQVAKALRLSDGRVVRFWTAKTDPRPIPYPSWYTLRHKFGK